MNLSKLMAHPQASNFYGHIDAAADPARLAADYARFIAHGTYTSHCYALAIEFHVRQLAQLQFQKMAVLRALESVEENLSARRYAHNKILREGKNRAA